MSAAGSVQLSLEGKVTMKRKQNQVRYSKVDFQCQIKSAQNIEYCVDQAGFLPGALLWLSLPPHWQKLGAKEERKEEKGKQDLR